MSDFIIKKLNYFIETLPKATEEERNEALIFMVTICRHHTESDQRLIRETMDLVNKVNEQNSLLAEKIQHLECFINDANLTKQYEFYSKRYNKFS